MYDHSLFPFNLSFYLLTVLKVCADAKVFSGVHARNNLFDVFIAVNL